jgi:thioredoxin-like negative regulator of GroEL
MRSLFTLIIITSITLWTGCSDKNDDTDTPVVIQKKQPKPKPKPKTNFSITDIDQRSTTVSITNGRVSVAKVTQPLVIINLFAPWSAPSCGMIPYLDALQKRYPKELFVIGIVANSDINNEQLRHFMKQQNASYFISNGSENDLLAQALAQFVKEDKEYPIPLTILFKNGKYTMHYVGATPIEMIKADIEQLRRK